MRFPRFLFLMAAPFLVEGMFGGRGSGGAPITDTAALRNSVDPLLCSLARNRYKEVHAHVYSSPVRT